MPQVTVKKWGNSPSVRLPVAVMREAELHVDDVVNVNVDEEGRIILTPVRKDEPTLESLLATICITKSPSGNRKVRSCCNGLHPGSGRYRLAGF